MTTEARHPTDLSVWHSEPPFPDELLTGTHDRSHVWGEFTEAMLDPSVLLREIVVYPGARTSIHCHMHQSELNIVAEGAVEILLGTHPAKLRTRLVMAGHAYRVPAGTYHAVRFARPAHPATRPWARLFELVTGFAAPDDIERHEPAVPGGPPPDGNPFLGGLVRVRP
ncbi:hypothetical protein [Catellatospora bangladeshensis]|uniref:Mannose-6-phosphate isomerase type II C-terminal domain-containing protein n=1 Tax=Catellatospora bangladeshensis TaxID=310355 RepID=A0A8J3NI27_9ACTN|nr:hypothetical protein [Catellatospora bangladeshensis]GIF82015.1 hypothetical protein Cba03nite_33640 [Catellatospora bangladeshensis]